MLQPYLPPVRVLELLFATQSLVLARPFVKYYLSLLSMKHAA